MTDIIIISIISIVAIFIIAKGLRIVPQRKIYIIERFGKYNRSCDAGLHLLIPIADKVAYVHTLKEQAIDVDSQICITKDNISVEVDGILYLRIIDPKMASYGIDDYRFASIQLAQTTMRSVIGRMELDKTFEERDFINSTIVEAVDKASDAWGIKVTRYEVKNITPPKSIKDAMEKQMRAEREKRAIIAQSEGDKQARINVSIGMREELVYKSEGEKIKRENEAQGKAIEIEEVAKATAHGIEVIAKAISAQNGDQALNLRVAEQYLSEFGKLASKNNTMIIPSNLSDIASVVASATSIFNQTNQPKKPNSKK